MIQVATRVGRRIRGSCLPAFVLALLSAGSTPAPVSASPVEAPHPVYLFLRRLETRGILERPFLGSLPFARERVLALLLEAQGREASLGDWERKELERHLVEFNPEIRRKSSPLAYSHGDRRLEGDAKYFAGGYLADTLPLQAPAFFNSLSARVEGVLSPNLSFASSATIGTEMSGEDRYFMNYDPQRGLPYNTRKRDTIADRDGSGTFDAFRTVVSWRGNGWGIEAGNDWNQWGPGAWQHPTLGPHPWFWVHDSLGAVDSAGFGGTYLPGSSRLGWRYPGEAAPPTQVRMDVEWRFLKYTKFFAEKIGLGTRERAFLVAHRLEARLARNLLVGVHEMVAYAGRSFEATYAIPFVPLKFAEHQVGDKDNIALGFDVDWRLSMGMRAYAEVFLDDLIGPLDFFGGYWGNKYALVAGWEAYDLLVAASCLQVEYARVEPWLYGHHLRNNQLQHYGSLLGSSLPANSHAARLRWSLGLPRGFGADLEAGFLQRQARGRGSLFDVHDNAVDGETKEFLGSDPETRVALRAGGSARWRRFVLAQISLGWLNVAAWRGVPGRSLGGPTASGTLAITY